jgi:hypothetical protein
MPESPMADFLGEMRLHFAEGATFLTSNYLDESSPLILVKYRTPIAQLLVVVELVVPVVA